MFSLLRNISDGVELWVCWNSLWIVFFEEFIYLFISFDFLMVCMFNCLVLVRV